MHTVTARIWSTYTAINYDINYIFTETECTVLTHGAQCDDMCGGGPGVIMLTAPVILDNCLICVNY